MAEIKHVYEVRPRKDKRGADLISDVLPFGRLWYMTIDGALYRAGLKKVRWLTHVSQKAVGSGDFYGRSHCAPIDAAHKVPNAQF